MKKSWLLLAFSHLFIPPAFAEPVLQKAKLWTAVDLKGQVTDTLQYYLEPQLRFISDSQCFNEANLYVGLGYPTPSKVTFWVGNMFNTTHKANDGNTKQYRIWEQISWNVFDSSNMQIDSRTRFEQRKQEHQASWSLRLREKLEFGFPLPMDYLFILYDEIFLNFNHPTWVYHSLINQNRAFAGFSIPLSKTSRLEIGYLNQWVDGNPVQVNHVLNCVLRMKEIT